MKSEIKIDIPNLTDFFYIKPEILDFGNLLLYKVYNNNLYFNLSISKWEKEISIYGTVFDLEIKNVNEIKILDDKLFGSFSEKGKFIISKDLINSIFLTELEIPKKFQNLLPIKYDETDLLEIFCNVPEIINQENKIFRYESIDLPEFIISFTFFVYENYILLALINRIFNKQVFYAKINDVEKIEKRVEKSGEYLYIFIKENEEPFRIFFRPDISVRAKI